MDEEFRHTLRFGLPGVFGHRPAVQRGRIDIKTAAGTHDVPHDEPDEQRKRGDNFEIEKGFAADPANFFHVVHAGDPGDQGAENHQRNDHGDHTDERIAEGLHGNGRSRTDIAEDDGNGDAEQHLERESHVERLLAGRGSLFWSGGGRSQHSVH